MAMRPELKTIINAIKSANGSAENIDIWCKALESGDQNEWLRANCLKLKSPVEIEAGTRWISKSSSGTVKGRFVKDCKIVGVIHYVGYQAVLDKDSIASDYMIDINSQDLDSNVTLAYLSTDILRKIAEKLP